MECRKSPDDNDSFNNSTHVLEANRGFSLIIGANDFSSYTAIIVIVSLVSLTAIGGYFFIRKRKEQ